MSSPASDSRLFDGIDDAAADGISVGHQPAVKRQRRRLRCV